MKAYSFFQV